MHKRDLKLGPAQPALVRRTFEIHFFRSPGSRGKAKSENPCSLLLLQLAATHFSGITTQENAKSRDRL